MDDLISRQAAIDALNKMKIYRPLDSDRYVISDCLNKIVNLPSAQQWIPCSERLPERNGYYLVTGRKGAVNKRLYKDGYWYGNWAIIAWLPLPEPYKGEEE